MKKVAILGKGDLAIHVCEKILKEKDYELVAVVPVIPEPTWTQSLSEWADNRRVEQLRGGDYYYLTIDVDLIISVFYDKILREDFIKQYNKIINIHNGPLPKYRGVSPINWALKNNEVEHGITIHEITSGIDNGPIIAQLKYSIYPEFDEVIDVYNRAIEYGKVLFDQTLPILYKIKTRKQDNAAATYYSAKENKELGNRRYFTKEQSCKK